MTIELIFDDGVVRIAVEPFEGADFVVVEGACPSCVSAEFRVRGRGIHTTSHDRVHAVAAAVCCERTVGELRVTVATIFGIEEDERVLRGRCRVY